MYFPLPLQVSLVAMRSLALAPACAFLVFPLLALATSSQMTEIEKEIADYDRQIQQNRELAEAKDKSRAGLEDEINKNQAAVSEVERRLAPLNIELEGLKLTTQKTKTLLDTALANPELVDSQKLEALHKDYRAAALSQSKKESELFLLNKELDSSRKRFEDVRAKKKGLALELDVLNRGVRSLMIKKPVIVESDGECAMHEDITPRACKEQALLKAKQNAVETGGTSLVRSLTEVSMNDLVRDEISIKTLAKIRYMEVLQSPLLVGQADLGKYVTKIRAVVQSHFPESQIAEADGNRPKPPAEFVGIGAPTIHTVLAGESMSQIAKMYGVRAEQIRKWNRLPDDLLLPEAGKMLIVGFESQKPKRIESLLKPSVPAITPTSAFNLAYNDYLNGKYDLAVAHFQRFVKDFPGTSLTPNAYYWLGESYYQQKDYIRAIQAFEHVSSEYPGSEKIPASLFKLGLAAGETGNLVKSKKNLKRVIEEFPTSDEAKLAKNKLAEIR